MTNDLTESCERCEALAIENQQLRKLMFSLPKWVDRPDVPGDYFHVKFKNEMPSSSEGIKKIEIINHSEGKIYRDDDLLYYSKYFGPLPK